jgi:hypothetical protein
MVSVRDHEIADHLKDNSTVRLKLKSDLVFVNAHRQDSKVSLQCI